MLNSLMAERQEVRDLTDLVPDPRQEFIDSYISPHVQNPTVLEAFRIIDRTDFVPLEKIREAHTDSVIHLTPDSTISQPSLVARMLEHAAFNPDGKALEIGTASGWNAALMAQCTKEVHTIEHSKELAESAASKLEDLGIANVTVHHGDGLEGLPDTAPFDSIIVTAAAKEIPDSLVEQLAIGGKMVIPIAPEDPRDGILQLVTRTSEDEKEVKPLERVGFVPIVSELQGGWSREDLEGLEQKREEAYLDELEEIAINSGMTLDALIRKVVEGNALREDTKPSVIFDIVVRSYRINQLKQELEQIIEVHQAEPNTTVETE